MAELFERVLHHMEGTETEIQNWETAEGIKTVEFQSFGPDRWIEEVHDRRRMMAIDCLAMILFSIGEFDLEGERRIVESWATELRNAVNGGEIVARDPVTLLALEAIPDSWEWILSIADADKFIAARGMEWRFGEVALHLYNECEQSIQKRRFPPWALDTNPPVPARNTATLTPVGGVALDALEAMPLPTATHAEATTQTKKRRDLLTPLLEAAQRSCESASDAAAVFTKLKTWAQEAKPRAPLVGLTSDGRIQWRDSNDTPKELDKKSLAKRLARQQTPLTTRPQGEQLGRIK